MKPQLLRHCFNSAREAAFPKLQFVGQNQSQCQAFSKAYVWLLGAKVFIVLVLCVCQDMGQEESWKELGYLWKGKERKAALLSLCITSPQHSPVPLLNLFPSTSTACSQICCPSALSDGAAQLCSASKQALNRPGLEETVLKPRWQHVYLTVLFVPCI